LNLIQIIEAFETVALKHKYINSFSFGESEDEVLYGDDIYPRCFLEMPFNQSTDDRLKTYRIGLIVSNLPPQDSITESNKLKMLSDCEAWVNQIIFKLKKDNSTKILFNQNFSFSLLYLISHTTDNSLGVRAEFEIQVINSDCNQNNFV
jgi:hypothetical protein